MKSLRCGHSQAALGLAAFFLSSAASAQSTASSLSGATDPVTGRPVVVSGTTTTARASSSTVPVATVVNSAATRLPWGHRLQGEVRVGVNEGYTFAIRYGSGAACDTARSTFCRGRSPVMMDFAAGFGVLEWLEVEARFRLGAESVFGVEASSLGRGLPLQAGLGLRAYNGEASRLKFALGVAVLADFTYGQDLDVVARVEEGIHYDVVRQFGFYFQLGETIQPLRAFTLGLDGGIGIQGRFP